MSKTNELTLKAWMAGIIDGEGNVGVYRKDTTNPYGVIQISNSELVLLNPFKKRYGGKISLQKKKGTESSKGIILRRDIFLWRLTVGKQRRKRLFEQCLLEILPYLQNPKKIQKVIDCLIFIRCARKRWEHLIPKFIHIQNKNNLNPLEEF